MSLISRFLGKWAKAVPDVSYKWKDQELGLYFKPMYDDPVWKAVTPQFAELIQQGFLEIYRRTGLWKYSDTNALSAEVINTINEVANRIGELNNLNPVFTILIAHQYVDADQRMRQMYRTRWVAFMVARNTCAPSPESYVDYIKARYFPGWE